VVSFPSVVLLIGFVTYKDGQLARRELAPFAAYLIPDLSKKPGTTVKITILRLFFLKLMAQMSIVGK
jgi:hypothetical protein